jgi:hypothetical protein
MSMTIRLPAHALPTDGRLSLSRVASQEVSDVIYQASYLTSVTGAGSLESARAAKKTERSAQEQFEHEAGS